MAVFPLLLCFSAVLGCEGSYSDCHDEAERKQVGFDEGEEAKTAEEADKQLVEHFLAIDTDGDGQITHAEISVRFREHMDRKHRQEARTLRNAIEKDFEAEDSDGNSRLSYEEHRDLEHPGTILQ
jgi:hypothetical protein